jgi:multidrug efflux system outer membrane protein
VNATANAGRSRITEYGTTPLPSTTENPANIFAVSLNGSWEIDLWGKLRRAAEAARADILSQVEGRRAVILTLVTSVANAYVNLRDLDTQLDIARRTSQSRKETYDLFQLRFRGGVISELELSQVKSEYEQTLSTIPFLEKVISQQENALSVLLGRNPAPIPRGKKMDELVLPAVPAGLPSALLTKRPDIRQAEQNLIAANARIGVARSLYFPSISLTGSFGFSSIDLSLLFTGAARTWSWGVPVYAPIFTSGAIQGQVQSAEAVQQQALLRYQQSIQTAFREVEDALIDQKRSREQLEIQTRQVESLRNYARIARLRFDNGYTSYIEVLDAERSLFNAELSHAQTKGVVFQALVNLYKAMGGGWVMEAERKTATVSP